jgi:hypothetical protein
MGTWNVPTSWAAIFDLFRHDGQHGAAGLKWFGAAPRGVPTGVGSLARSTLRVDFHEVLVPAFGSSNSPFGLRQSGPVRQGEHPAATALLGAPEALQRWVKRLGGFRPVGVRRGRSNPAVQMAANM